MPLPTDTLDRIYAGFLGKAIGVRLGAPVEPTIWTWDRIDKTYGEITGYLRDFKNFAADDDTNGPVYFIRALRDFGLDPSPQDVGRTWLNYAAEQHGMFWWGGYGISTEHTAFANLQSGVPAPESGSIARNGAVIAEQIGGQIFVDSWGWVCPGDPARAADLAARAASVSHDGNGLYGARFVAAAIAKAFVAETHRGGGGGRPGHGPGRQRICPRRPCGAGPAPGEAEGLARLPEDAGERVRL